MRYLAGYINLGLVIKTEKRENSKTEENEQNQQKACIYMHKSHQVRIRYPCQSHLTGSRVIFILLHKRSRASSDTDTLNSHVARHLIHPWLCPALLQPRVFNNFLLQLPLIRLRANQVQRSANDPLFRLTVRMQPGSSTAGTGLSRDAYSECTPLSGWRATDFRPFSWP